MRVKINQKLIVIFGIIVLIAVIGLSVSGYFVSPVDQHQDQYNFAKCLTEKGATVYVSKYCGHCQHQKEMFGDSFEYVNSVECTENQELCQEKGVRGVPTCIINGESYPGVQELETLSSLTGCPLN